MARVTVEDCLDNVDNRFELVIVASKRARDLSHGRCDALVPWGDDKSTVVALREIAAGYITRAYLDENSGERCQRAEETGDDELAQVFRAPPEPVQEAREEEDDF